jgi:hypothetical protein
MGTNNGHWEGDTLVVDVTGFNGRAWFDRAGNFASDTLHVVERYTMLDANTIHYEAMLEDPATFTEPWKISFQLYRNRDRNQRLLLFQCVEFGDLGSLEEGKLADVLVLSADPLENIRNTREVEHVMVGGVLYDAATLDQVAPEEVERQPFFFERDDRGRLLVAPDGE